MGNQQGKAAKKEGQNQNNIQNSQSQIPDNKNNIPNNDSNPNLKNSAVNINNNIKQGKNPSIPNTQREKNSDLSKRNSPQISFANMGRSKNNSALSNKNQIAVKNDTSMSKNNPNSNSNANQKINQNNKPNLYDQQQDENQFMPMMKLDPIGQIRLHITLSQLILQKNPKPHLKKNSSVYNSVMTWKKDAKNIYTFILKQDQNYQLVIEVDIQGNSINNKNQYWCALCPLNIPFGQTVKVGQMTCVNWYCKLQGIDQEQDEDDQNNLGPSIKNIDFKINKQTFGKWGQKIPKNFYDQDKVQVVKKVYQKIEPQKFVAYKQLSRYFDTKNIWRASTYVQQTTQYFRAWIIQVTDHNSVATISKQLHSDIKNRQNFYIKTMFQRQFGIEDANKNI